MADGKVTLDPEDIIKMTYHELKQELKNNRLSTAGKKPVLKRRLLEFIETSKIAPTTETAMEVDQEEVMNSTFTKEKEEFRYEHQSTPTNTVNLVLDDSFSQKMSSEDTHSFEVKSRSRAPRSSIRKSIRPSSSLSKKDDTVSEKEQETPKRRKSVKNVGIQNKENLEEREKTPSRQKTPSRIGDRFAKIHAKEMGKMETLGERQERINKRHEELTGNVPTSIKRLATPKSVKKTRGWQIQDPKDLDFKFGTDNVEDFPVVASKKTTPVEPARMAKKKVSARTNRDVKQITRTSSRKSVSVRAQPSAMRTRVAPKEATVVDDSSFVSFIATPKGSTPNRVPKRQTYTPHSKKKVFVDTTKLTDREFELAVEEGLIPGKVGKKPTKMELKQAESKRRRGDIIALRRKMNLK